MSLAPKRAGPARCGRTKRVGKRCRWGLGLDPGWSPDQTRRPTGFGPGHQAKSKRQRTNREKGITQRSTIPGWFNNGLIRRSARLPLPNYGPPTRAPVDSILWWLGVMVIVWKSKCRRARWLKMAEENQVMAECLLALEMPDTHARQSYESALDSLLSRRESLYLKLPRLVRRLALHCCGASSRQSQWRSNAREPLWQTFRGLFFPYKSRGARMTPNEKS